MIKVLIVEDENFLREGLVHTVDWASMECVVTGQAEDGTSGLEAILRLSPDIVITDIRMPGMDGLEMIGKARAQREFFSILLTGYSEFEYAKQAVSLNVSEYLLKPVDEHKLAQAVEKIARQLRLRGSGGADGLPVLVQPEKLLSGNKASYYVARALEHICSQYSSRLSIHGLAAELGVSDSYLSRKFREETGLTFVEYLNQYRVQNAARLLSEGRLRIGQIAEAVGFGEYKSFSAVFKRYMGKSCSEFEQAVLSEEQPDR